MTPHHSKRSSRRFLSFALLAIAFRGGEPVANVEACGWDGPVLSELTTFDPEIVGASSGLYYDPMTHGFGGACEDCSRQAIVAEWSQYL
jgi:hypothetical protein